MRKFIDIVESLSPMDDEDEVDILDLVPAPLTGLISRDDLEEAVQIMMAGHSLDGVREHEPRDREWALEDLRDALKTIAREFDGNLIHIYRSITAPRDMTDFAQPCSVGIHWTHNPNFTMGALDDEGVIEMEGSVGPEAINWPETICLAVDGVEAEIRLRAGATIARFSADIDGPVARTMFA